jgi:hypothetical protein
MIEIDSVELAKNGQDRVSAVEALRLLLACSSPEKLR